MKHITIPYGSGSLTCTLPENWQLQDVAEPPEIASLSNDEVRNAVKQSLLSPLGSLPLQKRLKPGNKIAIVVDDISRPTPAQLLTEPLVEYLTQTVGIDLHDITIIFALGVHRDMTEDEVKRKIGSKLSQEIAWENHDCYNNLVNLGRSSLGTPIFVNKHFHEMDFTIAIGLIEPHPWAGYSGGYKAVIPGIAGVDTIVKNHSLLMKKKTGIGKITDNPFRSDIDEIGMKMGLDLAINCVLNRDKNICKVFTGHPKNVHEDGVAYARSLFECNIENPVDIVIAGSAPLSLDFRQASKAAVNTKGALKKGGIIIVLSPCVEGAGNIKLSNKTPNKKLMKLLAKILPGRLLMKLIKSQGYGIEDGAASFEMVRMFGRYQYIFMTDTLTREEQKKLYIAHHVNSVDAALQKAIKLCGNKKNINVLVFPYGGCTYPVKK